MKRFSKRSVAVILCCGLAALVHCSSKYPQEKSPSAENEDEKPYVEERRIAEDPLVSIANTESDERRGDVVFVHGLGGNGQGTWESPETNFYWPEELGKDYPDIGVWVVNYESSPTAWLGDTMPIQDRSRELLQELYVNGVGQRPVVFIAHSLGGLVVKQMLNHALTHNNEDWLPIGLRTRGVVFLGTPNNGADLSTALGQLSKFTPLFRLTVTQEELQKNAPILRDFNIWYRNNVEECDIKTLVFYETKTIGGTLIVDQGSADPGISGVTPISTNYNHLSICKPPKKEAVYKSVAKFLDQQVLPIPIPPTYNKDFAGFVEEYRAARINAETLKAFLKSHVRQKVDFQGLVTMVHDDRLHPSYRIAHQEGASVFGEQIIARFSRRKFDNAIKAGDRIRLTGFIGESSNINGAILDHCTIVP